MNNVAGFEFAPLQVKAGLGRWGVGCGRGMVGDTHRNPFVTPNYKGLMRAIYRG